MTYLLFGVALSLSAIAAYYAVAGLIAIFAAAAIPIAIMGSLLEASKLVVASWLYRNWKEIPKLLKTYFTIALIVLMLLTSMGIFGFLSKAHLDQAIPTGDVQSKLSLIDEKIKTEKENLNASRAELNQLDQAVNQTMSRTTEASGAERAIAIRKSQQRDRARILKEIGDSQTKIAKLNEERSPIAAEVRKVEAEVGPIKYIAALIYGDNPETDVLEKAVRWVIIMIVLVFDPLAVLMLVAANWNLRKEQGNGWDSFFSKPPAESFPEKENVVMEPEIKEIVITDNINLDDTSDIKENTKPQENKTESEIPEIQIEEASKEWESDLYTRLEEKQLGRYQAETQPKTQSFLNKVKDLVRSPGVTSRTIEQEVDELQPKDKT